MKPAPLFSALLATFLTLPAAFADSAHHPAAAATGSAASAGMAEGTVTKVDKAAGKITIAHEAIETLNMPPMTMAYQAGDPAMLDKVKRGDKIRFAAERSGGVFVVKVLELAK